MSVAAQCIAPLGMESGLIPDKDITASSCYNDGNVAPQNGRFVLYCLNLTFLFPLVLIDPVYL